MKKQLELAEAQFIGFSYGSKGWTIIDLIKCMGLEKEEWIELRQSKYIYDLTYLSKSQKDEIDSFLKLAKEDKK